MEGIYDQGITLAGEMLLHSDYSDTKVSAGIDLSSERKQKANESTIFFLQLQNRVLMVVVASGGTRLGSHTKPCNSEAHSKKGGVEEASSTRKIRMWQHVHGTDGGKPLTG